MARKTVNEIKKLNTYEAKWKIKTNNNKFKIVPIAVIKKHNIGGRWLNGKVLGPHSTRDGRRGSNPHRYHLGFFQSLPSGLKLPTCCPEDHPSTRTPEETV